MFLYSKHKQVVIIWGEMALKLKDHFTLIIIIFVLNLSNFLITILLLYVNLQKMASVWVLHEDVVILVSLIHFYHVQFSFWLLVQNFLSHFNFAICVDIDGTFGEQRVKVRLTDVEAFLVSLIVGIRNNSSYEKFLLFVDKFSSVLLWFLHAILQYM